MDNTTIIISLIILALVTIKSTWNFFNDPYQDAFEVGENFLGSILVTIISTAFGCFVLYCIFLWLIHVIDFFMRFF